MGDLDVTLMLFQVSKRLEHFFEIFDLDPNHPIMEEITSRQIISRVDRSFRPYVMAHMLWKMVCYPGQRNMWMARGSKRYLYDEIGDMIEIVVPHGVDIWHHCNHIVMKNESRLLVRSATVTATRGHRSDLIVIENVDHGKLLEGIITSCHPSVAVGGKMILLEN